MPLAARTLTLDVELAGDRAVAVGERGHILLSDDYGMSWRQVTTPTRATLTAVAFADPQHGWAVGHDNTILHSRDGGDTWAHQYPAGNQENSFLDVFFLDSRRGFAVGAYGLYYETRNGGATWSRRQIHDEELHYNRLSAGPDGRLYLAVEGGLLLVSGDDGSTWEELPSPYAGSLFGVLPLTARVLIAYGLRGHVFRSINGGLDWAEIETPIEVLLADATRAASGLIVIAGQSGHFLLSRNAGQSFQGWQRPEVRGAAALLPTPDGALIVAGLSGLHRLQPPPVSSQR